MLNRWIAATAIALAAVSLGACRPQVLTPTELEAATAATDAYHAYEKGDCATVDRLTDDESLDVWEFNEMHHSMRLLNGFCREVEGDIEAARRVYRRLVVEAPTSFAADDAAERIRILKLSEEDPSYLAWMESARDRKDVSRPQRRPMDRPPVQFPPLAKATGIEGFTIVEFGVTKRGNTENPVVVDSRPPLLFDGTSIRAIRRWQYMRERRVDADDRQLIRLLFRRDGRLETIDDEPGPTATETE